jgi:hypothetical protein
MYPTASPTITPTTVATRRANWCSCRHASGFMVFPLEIALHSNERAQVPFLNSISSVCGQQPNQSDGSEKALNLNAYTYQSRRHAVYTMSYTQPASRFCRNARAVLRLRYQTCRCTSTNAFVYPRDVRVSCSSCVRLTHGGSAARTPQLAGDCRRLERQSLD